MSFRVIAFALFIAALTAAAPVSAANYRGMTAGWPNQPVAYPAANHAAYPAAYAAPGATYAARPVAAYYAPAPLVAYRPVTAAYANPAYLAGYRGAVVAQPAPVAATAYYAPAAAAYYQPATAYYAPAAVSSSPHYSYSVSPAGSVSAGSEAAAYYGQPAALNYVPPRFTYRTAYAAVPVYAYRPVTAYDPVAAQPTTCLQPAVTTTCQPQRHRWLSWLNPCNWFHHGRGGCGAAPAPTVAYCQPTGCGQPYYPAPTTTVIPTMPAPAATAPVITTPIPSGTYVPSATPRIEPPPTRVPATGLAPAELQPRLPAGTIIPGPSTTIPSAPPPGSFPTAPSTTPGFGGSSLPSSSFPSGTQYAPATDPYSASPLNSGASISGSGYRTPAAAPIRGPDLGPAAPPAVPTVPDIDAQQPRPVNRAPQLLSPHDDKTARRTAGPWAVVPARWPTKPATTAAEVPAARPNIQPASLQQPAPAAYDDGGWKSAASF